MSKQFSQKTLFLKLISSIALSSFILTGVPIRSYADVFETKSLRRVAAKNETGKINDIIKGMENSVNGISNLLALAVKGSQEKGGVEAYNELKRITLESPKTLIDYFETLLTQAIESLPEDLFGKGYGYDIRGNALPVSAGIVDLTPINCYIIGKALGKIYAREGDTILITGDQRWHTPTLRLALALGFISVGVNAEFSEEILGTGEHGLLSGENPFNHKIMIQISGSHGVPQKNGAKIKIDKEGRLEPLYAQGLASVYAKLNVKSKKDKLNFGIPKKLGQIKEIAGLADLVVKNLDKSLPEIDPEQPIIFDCRNSALIDVLKKLAEKKGLKNVRWFNDKPDPSMSGGIWDPSKSEALVLAANELRKWNIELKSENSAYRAIAFIFDGDGDRATAILEDGTVVPAFEMTLPFYQRFISDPINKGVIKQLRKAGYTEKIWLACDIRATSALLSMIDAYPDYAGYYIQPGYPPQRDFVRWRISELRKFVEGNNQLSQNQEFMNGFQHFLNTYFTAEASGHQFFHICPNFPDKVIDAGIAVVFNLLYIKKTIPANEAKDDKLESKLPRQDNFELVDLFKAFPETIFSDEVRIVAPNSIKKDLEEMMTKKLKEKYKNELLVTKSGAGKIDDMIIQPKEEGAIEVEGIKVQLKTGGSAMFKKSNTGEQAVLIFEGSTPEELDQIMLDTEGLIKEAVNELRNEYSKDPEKTEKAEACKNINLSDLRAKRIKALEKYILLDFKNSLKRIDPRISNIKIEQVVSASDTNKIKLWNGSAGKLMPRMTTAINEAVTKQIPNIGIAKDTADSLELRKAKQKIDGDATVGFEEKMSDSERLVRVASGEGEAEKLPGPRIGRTYGVKDAKTPSIYTFVDVIDGTTLVAKGLPGALSLGVLSADVNKFLPDLQAYAILVPEKAEPLNFNQPIEANLESNLRKIANALGKKVSDLHVVTHSSDTGGAHQALINELKRIGVRKITVPEAVTIETPYTFQSLLDKYGDVDTMIGVFGLPEIVINSILAKNLSGGKHKKKLLFRIASDSFPENAGDLSYTFKFSEDEEKILSNLGLDKEHIFSADDIVVNNDNFITVSAVTDVNSLSLKGIEQKEGVAIVNSLIVDPAGSVYKVSTEYKITPKEAAGDQRSIWAGELSKSRLAQRADNTAKFKDTRMRILQQLSKESPSKIFFLVIDGLGGLPINGKTELEAANHPELDNLAKKSAVGLVNITNILGITPGSGPGHFSIFGYNPFKSLGRGILDAFGAGIEVKDGDIVARGNFATLENDLIIDRRAGRISTEKAQLIIERYLSGIEIEGVKFNFYSTKEHRVALIARGEDVSLPITDSDPGKEGVAPLEFMAQSGKAERLAGLMNKLNVEINRRLANNSIEAKANTIVFRGFDTLQQIPTLNELYKLIPLASCTYPAYKGIAEAMGMQILPIAAGKTIPDQVAAVKENLAKGNFFYIHIKPTDKYGEDGKFADKAKIISEVDSIIPQILSMMDLERGDTLVVTGDHSTPAKIKLHSWHPLPVLIYSKYSFESTRVNRFTEEEAKNGSLGTIMGRDVMSLTLAHSGKLDKIDGPIKTFDGGNIENIAKDFGAAVEKVRGYLSANSRFFRAVGGETAYRYYLDMIWEWYKYKYGAFVTDNKLALVVHSSFFRNAGAVDALKEIIKFKPDGLESFTKLSIYGEGADKLAALFGDSKDVITANTISELIPKLSKWKINPETDMVVLRPIEEKIDLNVRIELNIKQVTYSEKTISTIAVAKALELLAGMYKAEGDYSLAISTLFHAFYINMKDNEVISAETYETTVKRVSLTADLPDIEPAPEVSDATKNDADTVSKFIDKFI